MRNVASLFNIILFFEEKVVFWLTVDVDEGEFYAFVQLESGSYFYLSSYFLLLFLVKATNKVVGIVWSYASHEFTCP